MSERKTMRRGNAPRGASTASFQPRQAAVALHTRATLAAAGKNARRGAAPPRARRPHRSGGGGGDDEDEDEDEDEDARQAKADSDEEDAMMAAALAQATAAAASSHATEGDDDDDDDDADGLLSARQPRPVTDDLFAAVRRQANATQPSHRQVRTGRHLTARRQLASVPQAHPPSLPSHPPRPVGPTAGALSRALGYFRRRRCWQRSRRCLKRTAFGRRRRRTLRRS